MSEETVVGVFIIAWRFAHSNETIIGCHIKYQIGLARNIVFQKATLNRKHRELHILPSATIQPAGNCSRTHTPVLLTTLRVSLQKKHHSNTMVRQNTKVPSR